MRIYTYILVLLIMTVPGCKFSKGFKIEPKIGLSYEYNGFSLSGIKLLNTYNQFLDNNKLPENSILYLRVSDLNNFEKKEGKVYLGCKLTVLDSNDKVVFEKEDLYSEESNGISPEAASMPVVKVRLSDPIVAGDSYKVKVHMYDKQNVENVLDIDVNIELTPSEIQINHEEKGLSFSEIRFSQKDLGELPQNIVKKNSSAAIAFYGLNGFTVEDEKIYPSCSLIVKDKSGVVLLEYDDLFKKSLDGISPEVVNQALYASVTFADPIDSGKEYNMAVHLVDRKNEKNEIKADIDIFVID